MAVHCGDPRVPTVGVIAERFGVRVHQVQYVVRTREIHPVGRAGGARIFSEQQVERIAAELRRVAAARGETHEMGVAL